MGKQSLLRQKRPRQQIRPTSSTYQPATQAVRKADFISRFGFWIVLLFFVVLATFYSLVVPLTQGEDELAHYRYISFIAETGRLPINYTERQQAWYRADWPPFYHLLVGWAVSSLDTTRPHLKDVGESPRRRLVGEIFYPRLIIYTEDANWPWQDGILAWHLGRFISILFAAGALIFTHLTVLELGKGAGEQGSKGEALDSPLPPCPPAPLLALAATALLAFTPRFLFTSAMLGDDSLFILLSAIFIWLLLRAVGGDERWWLYPAMGLVLGLSIVTKYSTGLLPLTLLPLVGWRARQSGWNWRKAVGRIALCWLFVLIGSSWWFAWIGYYFNTIPQDGLIFGTLKPLLASGPDVSMRRVFDLFGGGAFTGQERPDAVAAGTFPGWLTYLFQTFWGVPVLEHDPFFPWTYLLALLFCLLTLPGLWQLWRISTGEGRVTAAILGLIIALLIPFPILRFFLTHNILETGQGRHILYPAAQAIPILLVLGWAMLGQKFERPLHSASVYRLPSTVYIFLPSLLLLIWSLFQLDYMARSYPLPLPVRTTTFNPASIPQPLKHNFGEAIQLLGYDFVPDAEQSIINLTLFWKSLQAVDENYRVQVQLVDEAGQPHFTWLSHPLNGRYPTRAWDKGDVIRDSLPLPLAGVPANRYNLEINLLHEAEDIPVAGEAFQFIQIPLVTQPPISGSSRLAANIDYRLWVDNAPVRHRQTLPLSWSYDEGQSAAAAATPNPTWALVGPDDVPRRPQATGDATAIFIVGTDWPSGPYRLRFSAGQDSYQTDPLLTVANDLRQFDLSPLPDGFIPVEANFANQVKLLGYVLPSRRVELGGNLPLTLYWQSLAPVLGDYLTFAVLLDRDRQPFGQVDRYPQGFYSPMLWAQNEVVMDSLPVPIRADAHPGVYFLHIGQYKLVDGGPESLTLTQQDQPAGSAVVIGPIKVGGPPPGVITRDPAPQVRLNQTLGNQITLLGYSLDQASITNCQLSIDNCQLKMTLYWRAEATPNADYTTFVHLRDAANATVAQKDNPPAAGQYPTSLWDKGEIIVDKLTLSLANLTPGQYTPVVGLYDFKTGKRLPIPDLPANELSLQPIQIKE